MNCDDRRKRQKQSKGEGAGKAVSEDADVRLCPALQAQMGQKYVKESALSRAVLLKFLKERGDVTPVKLMRVGVQEMGGMEINVILEETHNKVADLKVAVAHQQGIAAWTQQIFHCDGKGGDGKGSAVPLADSVELCDNSQFAMYVAGADGGQWDVSSPMLARDTKQFKLSGEQGTIATKIKPDDGSPYNDRFGRTSIHYTLKTGQVMEHGKHRISLKIIGDMACEMYYGVVKVEAACNEEPLPIYQESTKGWFIGSYGSLCGSGRFDNNAAGRIEDGEVLSLEADLDAGTLRFWVNGKPHGPGYESGVKGRLTWAIATAWTGDSAQIVPTPELEPWAEWDGRNIKGY